MSANRRDTATQETSGNDLTYDDALILIFAVEFVLACWVAVTGLAFLWIELLFGDFPKFALWFISFGSLGLFDSLYRFGVL